MNYKVLDDINLETADGELVVVLGPSGCGKSTLLRLIAGLEEPDAGEIWIGTRRIDNLPPQKRNVALVFQNYALYPHMSVEQNLAFPLKVAGTNRGEIKERVLGTATLIGLSDRLKARPLELSGGQRQRVALGRAIIRQPDLYLWDEPLSNLDADLRNKMRRELVDLQRNLGTTTIHVTHDQTEALTMADRLVVIDSGKIRQIGTVDEVYNYPADLFVASFLGTPKINLLSGWVSNHVIKPFDLSIVSIPPEYKLREVTIGIRPEDILAGDDGLFSGEVTAVEYLGSKCIVTFKYMDSNLILLADPGLYAIGDKIGFSIRTSRAHIFSRETGACFTGMTN
ncbi:MAG: ABC transporter ATP-binding protein [Candidatus Zixiibacteriota bacterium]|nr:MAG: ABC transporter ATP-binding protein [candidate division Zixibacteria bacterium]